MIKGCWLFRVHWSVIPGLRALCFAIITPNHIFGTERFQTPFSTFLRFRTSGGLGPKELRPRHLDSSARGSCHSPFPSTQYRLTLLAEITGR